MRITCGENVMPERIVAILWVLAAASTPANADVVWHRDVQPIVQARCQACHTTGGVAPFALLTYDDALAHSAQMATMVEARLMPPWKPAAGCRSYEGDRSISQEEIDTIVTWARTGAMPGDPAEARFAPVPRREPASGDLTLDAGADYLPAPSAAPAAARPVLRAPAGGARLRDQRERDAAVRGHAVRRRTAHALARQAHPRGVRRFLPGRHPGLGLPLAADLLLRRADAAR